MITPVFSKIWIFAILAVLIVYLYYPISLDDAVIKLKASDAVIELNSSHAVVELSKKDVFVQQVLQTDIDGPYNIQPLQEFCGSSERVYQPGLIVKCEPPSGGFGNIKNMFLNFIRFAFEAGGV